MSRSRAPKSHDKDVLDHLGGLITDFLDKKGRRPDSAAASSRRGSPSSRSFEDRWLEGVRKLEDVLNKDVVDLLKEAIERPGEKSEEDAFLYLRAMLNDLAVASVQPSGKFLVRRVIAAMDLKSARVVIEYGAADGVITRHILPALAPDARLVAIERNAGLCSRLGKLSDPRLVPVYGDVRQLDGILAGLGVEHADVIVSGVPFSLFRPRARHELLSKTSDLLRPGGRFVAYQVTTHLIPLLADYFRKVETEFEIRNIPPLFVFKAFK